MIKCKNKVYIEQRNELVMKDILIDDNEINNLYWNIGKMIVEKQGGCSKAKYGDYLIENTSKRLMDNFGRGFSTRNLKRMRKLYLYYQKRTTLLSQLTCSHYLKLIKIKEYLS